MDFSCLILAGGQSRRMGQDKAQLRLDGLSMVERLYHKVSGIFSEIIIVDNAPGKFALPGVREINDDYPGAGPLGGIHAGLKAAKNQIAFVISCDLPFIKPEDFEPVLKKAPAHDIVVPVINQRKQVLFSSYQKTCLPYLEELLCQKKYQVLLLLDQLNTCYLEEKDFTPGAGERISFNLNTPADYQKALTLH